MRNTLAFLIVVLLLAVIFILAGCATYDISRCEDGVCSTAHISSPRKFKSIAFKYNGDKRTFELQAGDVSTDSTALQTLASVILMQQQQAQPQ
jgi:hypothetical protein